MMCPAVTASLVLPLVGLPDTSAWKFMIVSTIIHWAYYITLAPLIAGGKVMVGASGGEFGIRGFVAALDPDTGNELWRTYTVPAPGEPGSEQLKLFRGQEVRLLLLHGYLLCRTFKVTARDGRND